MAQLTLQPRLTPQKTLSETLGPLATASLGEWAGTAIVDQLELPRPSITLPSGHSAGLGNAACPSQLEFTQAEGPHFSKSLNT